MKISKRKHIWFIVGSQHLYGQETLDQVAENAIELTKSLEYNG